MRDYWLTQDLLKAAAFGFIALELWPALRLADSVITISTTKNFGMRVAL